jgi:hypothetical protein
VKETTSSVDVKDFVKWFEETSFDETVFGEGARHRNPTANPKTAALVTSSMWNKIFVNDDVRGFLVLNCRLIE